MRVSRTAWVSCRVEQYGLMGELGRSAAELAASGKQLDPASKRTFKVRHSQGLYLLGEEAREALVAEW
jgi:hypothetical protein